MQFYPALRTLLVLFISTSIALFFTSCTPQDPFDDQSAIEIISGAEYDLLTGNGSPSGAHFNLNIIGVPKEKTADMTNNEGHRIFVKLDGNTRISLEKAESFGVTDANGTDGRAGFQLPHPDPDGDGETQYSIWARSLGAPGGSADVATCATYTYIDEITGEEVSEEVCSSKHLIIMRDKGKSKFSDVSKQLLFIYADLDGDGVEEEYSLFDDALEDYLWSYNNNGLKLLQLRFYYN